MQCNDMAANSANFDAESDRQDGWTSRGSRNEDTCPLPSSRVRLPVDMVRLVLRELDVQWKSGNLDEGDRMVLHELAMDIDALANRPCPSGDPDIAGAKAHVSYSPIPPPVAPNVPSAPLAGDPQMPPDIMRPTDVTNGIVKKKPGNSPSGNMALVPSGENTAAGGSACTDPEAPTVEQLRQALLDIFQELDGDSSGTIGAPELRRALNALQFPRARTTKLLNAADQSGDGFIDIREWRRVVEEVCIGEGDFAKLADAVVRRKSGTGSVFEDELKKDRRSRCMIKPDSLFRKSWDVLIGLLLCYIAIMGPFIMGWSDAFDREANLFIIDMDTVILIFFIADILLNLRTGTIIEGKLEMNAWKVAKHYVQGFLIIDSLSTVPFEKMQNIKLMKMGKVSRITKVMKSSGKASKLSELVEDMLINTGLYVLLRPCGILFYMVLLCHWLAFFLKVCGGESLANYQDVSQSAAREYMASLYWAMTTMTTVGYGDLTPQTDWERIYSMIAMVIGGSFYGYVIGNICSMVANRDMNHAAYQERMDKLQAWLSHHAFPQALRSRVRRYLRSHLKGKSATSVEEIMADLSPDLREEVGSFLIHPDILNNPLFDSLSAGVLAFILHLVQQVTAEVDEVLCRSGAPGTAMFVITHGFCKLDRTSDASQQGFSMVLCEGDSFGEEIVLQLVESYTYTVIAQTDMVLYMIPESGFIESFSHMPDVVRVMHRNLASFRSAAGY